MNAPVNFDANASHSALPEVGELVRAWGAEMANPSAPHKLGQRARMMVEDARASLLELLGLGDGYEVIFTSGATEANNLAVANSGSGTILTSAVEHPSILEAVGQTGRGILIDPFGWSLPEREVSFVSFMLANNETGSLLPVRDVFAAARQRWPNALTHCDAVQAVGKWAGSFSELEADALTVSGHKFGALSGSGALVVRRGVEILPQILGGAQEGRRRAGTENVIGITSIGVAARAIRRTLAARVAAMERSRTRVIDQLSAELPDAIFHSFSPEVLPNTMSVRFPGVRADDLVVACDLEGVCISSGAACSAGKQLPSHVLMALGLSEAETRETVRISLEGEYQAGELERGCEAIVRAVRRMRETMDRGHACLLSR